MKKKLYFSYLLMFPLFVMSQGENFDYDIHNKKVSYYIDYEIKRGSKQVPYTSRYLNMQGKGLAQPLQFFHDEEIIPDLKTKYLFFKKDSIIKEVLHEWDVRNFEKSKNNKKPLDFQKALIKKYTELEDKLTKIFGKSEIKGSLEDLSLIDKKEGLRKSNTWTPNDSTKVSLYIMISNYYEQIGRTTKNPIHRIRLYITRDVQKKRNEADIGKRLKELTIKSEAYLLTLRNGDMEKSKTFLSERLIDRVTNQQIEDLISNIDFSQELKMYHHGVQMTMTGDTYLSLFYRYKKDTLTPPKEMIKILFDETDKVIGIQPVKLQ
ncbi:hypothetical protein [Aquimarina celericrescens]|uniref:Uncharacterized protein n=1 Tax=Aquimarina celericrescens TaxID=1964542 RepID=A0ABW5AVA6_9FLAO|nr:hypothetical protein [Aquimarina celericrescens]